MFFVVAWMFTPWLINTYEASFKIIPSLVRRTYWKTESGSSDFAGGLRVACRDCASCFKEETFKRAEEELAALRAITCVHLIDLTEPEYPRCCCMFAATRKP